MWVVGWLGDRAVCWYRVKGGKTVAQRVLRYVGEKGVQFIEYTLEKEKPRV